MSSSKQKRILVAEGNQVLCNSILNALSESGFEVKATNDGHEATAVYGLEEFDLVLTGVRLPNRNGIELLHYIRKNKARPVVLMAGSEEIADPQEAYDLGASGFLPLPFEKKDLHTTIQIALGMEEAKAPPRNLDSQFCPIRIDDFISGTEIRFDIYIRLSQEKYIKIATSGSDLNTEQLATYKSKLVTHLYLTKEDFKKYIGFNLSLSTAVARSTRIEKKKKVDFLLNASLETTKGLFFNDLNKESFQAAEEILKVTLEIVAEPPTGLEMLEALLKRTDALYAHSLAVSLYSSMIAKQIGWTSPRTLTKIAICGLFHDIGLKEVPEDILLKPRIDRTPEEMKFFESHPSRGSEILNLTDGMPVEVAQVALQHHEACNGLGYPQRLARHKIQPMARLVHLADNFCHLILPSMDHPQPITPSAAIKKLENAPTVYDEEFLTGLAELIVSNQA